jgi:hypothetical protein
MNPKVDCPRLTLAALTREIIPATTGAEADVPDTV